MRRKIRTNTNQGYSSYIQNKLSDKRLNHITPSNLRDKNLPTTPIKDSLCDGYKKCPINEYDLTQDIYKKLTTKTNNTQYKFLRKFNKPVFRHEYVNLLDLFKKPQINMSNPLENIDFNNQTYFDDIMDIPNNQLAIIDKTIPNQQLMTVPTNEIAIPFNSNEYLRNYEKSKLALIRTNKRGRPTNIVQDKVDKLKSGLNDISERRLVTREQFEQAIEELDSDITGEGFFSNIFSKIKHYIPKLAKSLFKYGKRGVNNIINDPSIITDIIDTGKQGYDTGKKAYNTGKKIFGKNQQTQEDPIIEEPSDELVTTGRGIRKSKKGGQIDSLPIKYKRIPTHNELKILAS